MLRIPGGPFVESRYFGEGIGIAVRKGNDLLRHALNWALFRIWEKGRFTDLWLRYFSISPFWSVETSRVGKGACAVRPFLHWNAMVGTLRFAHHEFRRICVSTRKR